MAFTHLQQLRKARAQNKGSNKRVAAILRRVADMLDKKGPAELTRREISNLQSAREMITWRLYENACTKGMQDTMNGKIVFKDGQYTYTLDKKDL
jgi:hypothetical protein